MSRFRKIKKTSEVRSSASVECYHEQTNSCFGATAVNEISALSAKNRELQSANKEIISRLSEKEINSFQSKRHTHLAAIAELAER